MYELNKLYGWSKFIIVVPSIAIREGVAKSFETMQEHFANEYGKRIQFFIYNSKQLSKIDAFASDSGLYVMIINTQAFNTSMNEEKSKGEGRSGDATARIIFSKRDEFGSRRPIDILAQTNPIMIIDDHKAYWVQTRIMLPEKVSQNSALCLRCYIVLLTVREIFTIWFTDWMQWTHTTASL